VGPDSRHQFIEVGWRLPRCSRQFHGVLGAVVDNTREGSRVNAVRCWLYLGAKAHGVGPARRCLAFSLQLVVAAF
jgi:hypothetical protein